MIGSAARMRMFGEVIRKFREVRIFLLHEGIYFYEEISWGVALRIEFVNYVRKILGIWCAFSSGEKFLHTYIWM